MVMFRYIVLLLLITGGASCSSGSGEPDGTVGPDQPVIPNTQTDSINGGLTGDLWVTGTPSRRFNFATGESVEVSEHASYPSPDGNEYVELIEEFRKEPDTSCFNTPIEIQQINIRDTRSGTVKVSFELDRLVRGPIRLSPDGQSIALFMSGEGDCGSNNYEYKVTVLSRDGRQLARANSTVITYDWTADNKLVFFRKDSETVLELGRQVDRDAFSYTTIATISKTDPDDHVRGLRVDSSGKRFIYELVSGQNQYLSGVSWRDAEIYMLDMGQGKVINSLTSSKQDPRINTPVFSPDGQWVIATENYSSGSYVSFYTEHYSSDVITNIEVVAVNANSTTYIVPVNAERQNLPPSGYSASVRPVLGVVQGGVTSIGFNPIEDQSWTPPIQ